MDARILVVDDSAFMRKIISEQISAVEGMTVAGTASNGERALRKIALLRPDAVTLDVEMPGMNGLEAVKHIRRLYDIPVFMLSSSSGKDITIEALEAGADDFIVKPRNLLQEAEAFQEELASKMQPVLQKEKGGKFQLTGVPEKRNDPSDWGDQTPKAVVIGASTGGPRVLLEIIKKIPAHCPYPIFIVQHMPGGFTASFAERLNQAAKVPVLEAKGGEEIQPGTVYLAPGDYHMEIQGSRIMLNQKAKLHGVRPAVDLLFESAAGSYGSEVVGIVLTGMGRDGTKGLQSIKRKGGHTIAQDQESSTVYGMPGNAVKEGVVDVSADAAGISRILAKLAKEGT